MHKDAESCLNAPFGARCFLTRGVVVLVAGWPGLNAPFGARCFLTGQAHPRTARTLTRLNAPFGARCFLTPRFVARVLGEFPES